MGKGRRGGVGRGHSLVIVVGFTHSFLLASASDVNNYEDDDDNDDNHAEWYAHRQPDNQRGVCAQRRFNALYKLAREEWTLNHPQFTGNSSTILPVAFQC